MKNGEKRTVLDPVGKFQTRSRAMQRSELQCDNWGVLQVSLENIISLWDFEGLSFVKTGNVILKPCDCNFTLSGLCMLGESRNGLRRIALGYSPFRAFVLIACLFQMP